MAYEYACFISYKRPPRTPHIWLDFAETFEGELLKRLSTKVGVYRDNALEVGDDFRKKLSSSLCKEHVPGCIDHPRICREHLVPSRMESNGSS